jgi:4-diphosphocytidyl-2-C-methyl-D-erythritol kinase
MWLRASPSAVEVCAPAKLNLFLEVLGRRADGFHELVTLMVPIRLHDRLRLTPADDGQIELDCRWAAGERRPRAPDTADAAPGVAQLPADPRQNTVWRALDALRRRAGVDHGVRVQLVKRIPAGAGLAGGSSDAAAALAGANRLWNLNLPAGELQSMAAEVGSDVPFFLAGGAAVCRGRGERIEPLGRLGNWSFVVVSPEAGLSTAAVFRACRPSPAPRPVEPLVAALRSGRTSDAARQLHNALEPAAASLSPWMDRLRDEFRRHDVAAARMSGSGTSWFALCRSARHARHVAGALAGRGLGRVWAVQSGA